MSAYPGAFSVLPVHSETMLPASIVVEFVLVYVIRQTRGGLKMKTKLALTAVVICIGPVAACAQDADFVDGFGRGTVVTVGSPPASLGPRTIPFWSSSFTYRGATFPLVTAGTNPANGSATTVIPTVIIPLRLIFADGNVLDVTTSSGGQPSILDRTLNSPIFQSTTYTTGETTVSVNTQYADAMQRAQFWNYVSTTAPDYHVLLSQPAVLPVQEIQVPSNLGHTVIGSVSRQRVGLIDFSWFATRTKNLVEQLHLDPASLPIFLEHNTFFYDHEQSNCCVLAFFFNQNDVQAEGSQPVQLFVNVPYTDPKVLRGDEMQDVYLLSHVVTRFINDPFGVNSAPSYFAPLWSPSCSTALHVSDPVWTKGFELTMNGFLYHLSDVAFLPWFEEVSPSPSVNGYYSFLNNLQALSPCP